MNDSVKAYTKSATRHKLLTKEQEQDLARRMSNGCAKSRDKLISSNLRLALSVANKYRSCKVSMEDLIQEANVGLIRAVDRFDYKKGFRFSTYAIWWIRQAVKRFIAAQSHVKFPTGSRHLIWKINNARKDYELEFGEMPSDAEVAEILGLDEKLVSARPEHALPKECGPYPPLQTVSGSWQQECSMKTLDFSCPEHALSKGCGPYRPS